MCIYYRRRWSKAGGFTASHQRKYLNPPFLLVLLHPPRSNCRVTLLRLCKAQIHPRKEAPARPPPNYENFVRQFTGFCSSLVSSCLFLSYLFHLLWQNQCYALIEYKIQTRDPPVNMGREMAAEDRCLLLWEIAPFLSYIFFFPFLPSKALVAVSSYIKKIKIQSVPSPSQVTFFFSTSGTWKCAERRKSWVCTCSRSSSMARATSVSGDSLSQNSISSAVPNNLTRQMERFPIYFTYLSRKEPWGRPLQNVGGD